MFYSRLTSGLIKKKQFSYSMLRDYRSSLFLLFIGLVALEAYAVTVSTIPNFDFYVLIMLLPVALVTALSFFEKEPIVKKLSLIGSFGKKHSSVFASVFEWLLLAYLALLLLNSFWKVPFNLNVLLVVVLVSGVLSVLFPAKPVRAKKTSVDTWLVWGLGVLGTALVFLKTGSLGWLRYVISLLAGVLIVLLGYLVYEKEEKEKPVYLAVTSRGAILTLSLLFVLSCVLTFWLGLSSFRIVFGSLMVLFVPGFSLSYAFFSVKEIDVLERIALSFALSIATVPLLVFYLNLAGLRISAWSVLGVCVFVTALGYVIYRYKPFSKHARKR